MTTSSFPSPLQLALEALPTLINSLIYARSGSIRAMRIERQQAIIALLGAMLRSSSLQHDGAIVAVHGLWAKPKTLQELANQAGLKLDRAKKALQDIYDLDLAIGKQIKRKSKAGTLEVSSGLRCLTKKFWQSLGLWDLWKKSVEWAKERATHKLLIPFKKVSCKTHQAVNKAGNVVKGVLTNLKNGVLPTSTNLRCLWIRERLAGGPATNFENWLAKKKKE